MLCFRLFSENNPAAPLADAVAQLREGHAPKDLYAVEPASFQQIPNAPFAYWVSERIRRLFVELPAFEGEGRHARLGASTKNDFRFLRICWEVPGSERLGKWKLHAKGGKKALYYADIHLVINWGSNGEEMEAELLKKFPYLGTDAEFVLHRKYPHFHPGLTWTLRTQSGLGFRVLPNGSTFANKGPAAFVDDDNSQTLLALLAVCTSSAFRGLVDLQMSFGSYEVGVIQRTALPRMTGKKRMDVIADHATKCWWMKRNPDRTIPVSHAFFAPALSPVRIAHKSARS
jgi:hypothetical protein